MKKFTSRDYALYGKQRLEKSPLHNLKRTKQAAVLERIVTDQKEEDSIEREELIEEEPGREGAD